MSCEAIQHDLDEYVDNTLAPEARERVERHLDGCAACAGLASDLFRLRDAARTLGPVAPPERVWHALAERVRQTHAAAPAVSRRPGPVRRAFPSWAGLAAALLLAAAGIVAGLQREWRAMPASTSQTDGTAGQADTVQTIAEELLLADRLYSDAIARLETLAQADASGLDPAIAESLRRNQAVLDRAIAESRAALEQDPASRAARESLFQALRQKLGLLQDTVALVNDLRASPEAAAPAPSPGKSS
jgi:hypothetical protein